MLNPPEDNIRKISNLSNFNNSKVEQVQTYEFSRDLESKILEQELQELISEEKALDKYLSDLKNKNPKFIASKL